MFSRKLAFVDSSSKLDIRAPAVTKSCSAGTLGKDGCDGNHGADGPTGKANNALSNFLHSLKYGIIGAQPLLTACKPFSSG